MSASWYSIKLVEWTRGDIVRIYVNTRYVDSRETLAAWANGGFFYASENGGIRWSHGFRTGPNTISRAERVAEGMLAIIDEFSLHDISFSELRERIKSCATKNGNFSARQYEKQFLLPN